MADGNKADGIKWVECSLQKTTGNVLEKIFFEQDVNGNKVAD